MNELKKLLLIIDEPQELHPHPPKVKPMPKEGSRVLAFMKGEWIVLEVRRDEPSYEDNYLLTIMM